MVLRPLRGGDAPALLALRAQPGIVRWWHAPEPGWPLDDEPDVERRVIEVDGEVAGFVQWHEELDPMYRHAGIDLFVDERRHRRGFGTDALRTLIAHLVDERGHHRLVIDPAADNIAAIAAYAALGFRPVGRMRAYEHDLDGDGWHDGLLMDLLAEEWTG